MIFNIYYESLEQGIFYVKDNIIKIDPTAQVNLVKKRQQQITSNGFSSYYSNSMSKILYLLYLLNLENFLLQFLLRITNNNVQITF